MLTIILKTSLLFCFGRKPPALLSYRLYIVTFAAILVNDELFFLNPPYSVQKLCNQMINSTLENLTHEQIIATMLILSRWREIGEHRSIDEK